MRALPRSMAAACVLLAFTGAAGCGTPRHSAPTPTTASASARPAAYQTPMPTDLCSMVDTRPVHELAPSTHVTGSTSTHRYRTARCQVHWGGTDPRTPEELTLLVFAYYAEDVAAATAEYDAAWKTVVGPTGTSTRARKLTDLGRPAFAAWVQLTRPGSVDVYLLDRNLVLKVAVSIDAHDAVGTTGLPAAKAIARVTPAALRN